MSDSCGACACVRVRLHCVELGFVGVALVGQHLLQHVGQHDVEVVDVEICEVVRGEECLARPSLPLRASRRHSAS